MRNCFCYEDLDAKKRNTELNDSYLAASTPTLRHDYSWRSLENERNTQFSDLENSNRWEQKKDSIRSRSTSTLPNDAMDEVQQTLERLKIMKQQGLIDDEE